MIVSSFITWPLLRTDVRERARTGRDKRRFILNVRFLVSRSHIALSVLGAGCTVGKVGCVFTVVVYTVVEQ